MGLSPVLKQRVPNLGLRLFCCKMQKLTALPASQWKAKQSRREKEGASRLSWLIRVLEAIRAMLGYFFAWFAGEGESVMGIGTLWLLGLGREGLGGALQCAVGQMSLCQWQQALRTTGQWQRTGCGH